MYRTILAGTVGCAMLLGGALAANAGESTFEMQALRAKGPGPVIGTIQAADSNDGVVLKFDLTDLPPGPNRLYLHDAANCAGTVEKPVSSPVTTVNVEVNEDGARPLKKTVVVPGMDLGAMSGKALVIRRGSEVTEGQPEQTGAPRLVACGIEK